MWHDLKLEHVGRIEKTVAEFTVWMITVLPYAKMKVKIYEDDHGNYKGRTDLQIKRKFDGCPESALSLIHISEPTRLSLVSRMPSSA